MPQQMWKHACSENESSHWMGAPVCRRCAGSGEYDGWHPRMHEAMAQYQTRYRLKPVGPHRRMADELFGSVWAKCQACDGRGLRDTADGFGWQGCNTCHGLGSLFTKPADEVEALRRRVLAAYPDAAADPVPDLFAGPIAFSGTKEEVVNLSKMDTREPATAVFDGFPYLVTRVVPTMYHISLLPEDLSCEDAEMLVRRQVEANQLPTCLVVASDRALSVAPDGSAAWSDSIPCGGIIVADRLQPCRRFAKTRNLAQRCARLNALLSAQPREGFMFGDLTKGGRKPTFEESVLLAGCQANGVPRGLVRCDRCREWQGRCLDPSPEFACQVMDVHCRCANNNRCAACGELLHERKLNANEYNEADGQIWHTPGFSAFSHRCAAPMCDDPMTHVGGATK